MENKYFTPNIEDLHVGYECKIKEVVEDSNTRSGYNLEWVPYIIGVNNIGTSDIKVSSGSIRTPYLSKEQIANEGWKIIRNDIKPAPYKVDWVVARKGDYELCINLAMHDIMHMEINKTKHSVLYRGECKSINELRTIFKFLKIK